MNLPTNTDATRSKRLAPEADHGPASSIRVLARLPRVGSPAPSSAAERSSFDGMGCGQSTVTAGATEAQLRLDEASCSFEVCTEKTSDRVETSSASRTSLGKHRDVDSLHSSPLQDKVSSVKRTLAASRLDEASEAADDEHSHSGDQADASPSSAPRRFRIDAVDQRRGPSRSNDRRQDATTLSGSIFQAYSAIAPHTGMLSAAALVIAGSLLYLLAFARSGVSVDPRSLLEFQNGWSEQAAPVGEPTDLSLGDAASESNLSINAGTDEPAIANAAIEDWDLSMPSIEGPAIPSSEDGLDAPLTSVAPQPDDGGITPTPQATPYPMTPYPEFVWQQPGAGTADAAAPAVAGRPAPLGAPTVAPR